MKEIGERLKEARESIGVSIEEAAEDLKLRPSQIENIEEGNLEAFKDIFYLKYFIRDYSKYLGLNYEDMVDEFNEFLFDYTSKISLSDIKKARKSVASAKEEVKKIASPYTLSKEKKPFFTTTIIYIIIGILLLLIAYFIVTLIQNNDTVNDKPIEVGYIIG